MFKLGTTVKEYLLQHDHFVALKIISITMKQCSIAKLSQVTWVCVTQLLKYLQQLATR